LKARADHIFTKSEIEAERLVRHEVKKKAFYELRQRAENERNEQRDAVRIEQREFELKMLKEQGVTFITFIDFF
jgi:hypothetical protein